MKVRRKIDKNFFLENAEPILIKKIYVIIVGGIMLWKNYGNFC